ncbi:MAG TPA: hypothetical protein VIW21_09925 [Chthoniobacterales bacterium]
MTRLLLAGCVAVTWRLAFFSFCGSACPVVEKAKAAIVPIIANRFIDKLDERRRDLLPLFPDIFGVKSNASRSVPVTNTEKSD